ncbi:Nascent polypeptide-associated complex protein [Methanomassiliicoccales archaeon RumEn M1]|jgi:nascent polypeptide-associated complex subunit alpha|nr:Nascent polypeptide-associated complex protein [Methanomassiliicoccales archaeon RumEn M1]
MMPGMRGVNPRQMKQAMKRLGITTEELKGVEEVIIRTKSKEYVITEAAVTLMDMQGQKTFQVVGEAVIRDRQASELAEPAEPAVPEEDIQLVMDQTGCDRERAIKALKDAGGQPAEAILGIMSS